jgi:hypothetical protein
MVVWTPKDPHEHPFVDVNQRVHYEQDIGHIVITSEQTFCALDSVYLLAVYMPFGPGQNKLKTARNVRIQNIFA